MNLEKPFPPDTVRLIAAPIAWVCASLPVLVNSALQVQKLRDMVHSLACSGIKAVNHTRCDYHLKVAACNPDSVGGGPSSRAETTGQPCRAVSPDPERMIQGSKCNFTLCNCTVDACRGHSQPPTQENHMLGDS